MANVWLTSLLSKLGVWSDNTLATSMALNPVYHSRTKHIEIDIHFMRDLIMNKQLEVRYVPTYDQTVDALTKMVVSIQVSAHESQTHYDSLTVSLSREC